MPWQRRHIWKCASEYIKVGAKPRHPLQSESSLSARRTALHVAPFPIPTDPGLVPVKVTLSELHNDLRPLLPLPRIPQEQIV